MMEATLSAYNPTWRDRLAQWMLGDGRPTAGQRDFVSGLLGSAGTGSTGASVADFTPAGGLLGAQEAAQAGDAKGVAMAMLPMPGARGRAVTELSDTLAKKFAGVDFNLSQRPGGPVVVNKVVVPPDMRGKGVGTQFMRDVLAHADQSGVPVALSPSSDFGGNKSKLVDWYKSLGFVPNKGRKADLSISESMVRQPAPVQQSGIIAYHGSPHSFDRFDLSKIGTGEGAQAYGHGLYFADSEGVARSYRDALSGVMVGNKPAKTELAMALGAHNNDIESLLAERQRQLEGWKQQDPNHFIAKQLAKDVAELEKLRGTPVKSTGSMYQVRINADPEHFLDWDKKLSEQSDFVRSGAKTALAQRGVSGSLADYIVANKSGSDALNTLARGEYLPQLMPPEGDMAAQASSALHGAGIPGIKYLDQGSRGAGEGSRNYVVFDDKLIDILRKYGLVGLLGGGAAMGAGQQSPNAPGL